ncbi:hypothetical protein N9891_01890 [bacterium]|nr:hypothetical protein [bacterium]
MNEGDGYKTGVPEYLKEAICLGWGGAKSNLLPGAVLWVVGLTLVISYYQVEAVAAALDQVGELKVSWSPWFAMVSTALFGSLAPWILQAIFRKSGDRQPFRQVPLLMIFWGVHGWQVEWLYRIQSKLFGDGIDAMTIVKKVLVDEFVWAPFLALWQLVLGYLYIENDCSLKACREALKETSFLERAIPMVITNWVIWIPAVSLIYLFPPSLQLPLMNLILTLWCLILIFFAKNA